MRLLVFAALLLPGTAAADTDLTFYFGGTHTENSDLTLRRGTSNQLTFHDVAFAGHSFESPPYYGGRVGHFFGRHFGVEAEFIHEKLYAHADRVVRTQGIFGGAPVNTMALMSVYAPRFSISHGNNLLLFNGVYRHDFLRDDRSKKLGKLILSARAGVGPTIPHSEVQFAGGFAEGYSSGRVVVQMGGGAEWRLWRGLYATGEYKFTHNPQRVDTSDRSLRLHIDSHHGIVGVSVHL